MIIDTYTIFTKQHISLNKKVALFFRYLQITFKNFAFQRPWFTFLDYSHQSFFGYNIKVPQYYSFYIQFRECFVDEIYYFKSESEEPFIIDCGTNLGMAVLYFKWLYPKSEILSFEPSPGTFAFAEKNVGHFDNVTLKNVGVGARKGSITFYNDTERPGLSTGNKDGILEGREDKIEEIEVKIVKLSDYIKKPVDMLKVDIEGMESEVLNDIQNKIGDVANISMEYHLMEGNLLSNIIRGLEKTHYLRCEKGKFKNSIYSAVRIQG